MKKPWLSKTLWTNFLIAGAAFFPPVNEYVQAHPFVIVEVLAVANIVLRALSHDQLSLQDA